jgi:putative membrane protein
LDKKINHFKKNKMHNNNWWGWGMHMMWIVWVPLLVFCMVVLIRFFNKDISGKSEETNKESPLDILKRRYANGELSTEEYEERKKELDES